MTRHHEVALYTALDRLYLEGAVAIQWEQLYLWFDAERLGRGAYRELQQVWEEVCTKYGHTNAPELKILKSRSTIYLRLFRDPLDGPEQEAIVPLKEWV